MTGTKINQVRLNQRLADLAQFGARPDGGVCRLAVSDEDKAARDQVVAWMKNLGMQVKVDQVGNLIGIRAGKQDLAPVVMGSHIDTVPTGGRYDGAAGVMAGLEVLETLNDFKLETERPIMLVAFTNEEGVRFRCDMLGSRGFCGFMDTEEAYGIKGVDGTVFGEELQRIGYAGEFPLGAIKPYAYMELHIEQGPVLDREQIQVGAVGAITGISWHEATVRGEANHAGTTPTYMRRDAGLTAARLITYMREIADSLGENQRATCGMISFSPNAINVIPAQAVMSIDLRNSDEAILKESDRMLEEYVRKVAEQDGTTIEMRPLAWVKPESCAPELIAAVSEAANDLGYSVRPMISGAVHDALMLAKYCPTGMIFVPSKNGISHNPAEYTSPEQLEAGANVLLRTILKLASRVD